jgi:transcriptional regulator with XRE-family HTH domain
MQTLGSRIRSLRQDHGLSLNDFAARSGFSKGFLSKIENGRAQPPIATLMKLAAALGCSLGTLLDGSRSAAPGGCVLTRKAERERVPHSDERGYAFERLALASPFALTPTIIHLDEEQGAPPSFRHEGEELVLALTGRFDYAVGGQVHRLRSGDSLVFDARQAHGPIKLPGVRASFLAVFVGLAG